MLAHALLSDDGAGQVVFWMAFGYVVTSGTATTLLQRRLAAI